MLTNFGTRNPTVWSRPTSRLVNEARACEFDACDNASGKRKPVECFCIAKIRPLRCGGPPAFSPASSPPPTPHPLSLLDVLMDFSSWLRLPGHRTAAHLPRHRFSFPRPCGNAFSGRCRHRLRPRLRVFLISDKMQGANYAHSDATNQTFLQLTALQTFLGCLRVST